MKNLQRGSVTLWVIIILVVVILGIGGYIYLKNSSAQTEQVPINVPVQTNTNVQSQTSVVPAAAPQSCGEVINAPSSDTVQQQKNATAYACMSHALVTCSPATITVNGSGTDTRQTFEILSGGNGYCPILQTVKTLGSRMTCNIPSDFISAMNQFLQTKNQTGMLFYGIPFFFVPPSTPISSRPIVKNPLTGQVATAQCSSE